MSERLQTILEEIENGTIKDLYNVKFSVEELLSKDDSGVTFLEQVFKKGISLDYRMNNIIKNSIEIAYIYCENNQSMYFFELEEQDLFSKINNQTYIEYFIDSQKLTDKMVMSIKKHSEIIDTLIDRNQIYYLQYLDSNIVKKLTLKNSEDIYEIEKYLKDDKVANKLIPLINDPNVLIEICQKYNKDEWLKKANENILMSKSENGEFFINYLINEKHTMPELLLSIPKSKIGFVKFLIDNNLYKYLVTASEYTLLLEIDTNKTLLEFLIEKGYAPKFNSVLFEDKTLNILKKYNKLDLAENVRPNLLLKSPSNVLGIEDTSENETLLEYMLDRDINPLKNNNYINDDNVIKILYKLERPDLLVKAAKEKLFVEIDDSITYFDYILDCIKENKLRMNLNDLFPYCSDVNKIISYYLSIAKHDMMEYMNELKEEDLLKKYNNQTLLEALLEADKNLTLKKLLTDSVKRNPNIAAILKSKGLEQQNVDVSQTKEKFSKNYLKSTQNTLGIGPLPQEGELLLNQLRQLFLSDGKSDENLINALVSGYKHALFVNYELNIFEIKNLIKVKQDNKDKFYYLNNENGAFFSKKNGSIHCDTISVETVLHETGHALHYYLAENSVPDNYQEVIFNIRTNPEILKKVDKYAEEYSKIKENISAIVERKCQDFFTSYYNEERKNKISEFLSEEKNNKKEKFRELGIPEDQLDIILSGMFTEEEYILHQKRIYINENVDAILRSEFGSLMAIGDILDAVYEGGLHSGTLKNNQGQVIKKTAGHGLAYYYDTFHGFDEMVANFASISKSKDSTKMLNFLRELAGNDLYNMLSDFYYRNIVGIKEENLKTGKSMGGK